MGEGVEKVVSKHQLFSLVKESARIKSKTGELNGKFGERVKNAADNGHLHKKAFGVISGMHRMEELTRNDFIRSLRLYLDMAEEELWVGDHHGDLLDGDEADEGGDEQTEEADADAELVAANVQNLRGIKPISADKVAGLPGADAPGKTH